MDLVSIWSPAEGSIKTNNNNNNNSIVIGKGIADSTELNYVNNTETSSER